jgi:AraC family transcriptional activator of pobA
MIFNGKSNELLMLDIISQSNKHILEQGIANGLRIVWFKNPSRLKIDGVEYFFTTNQIAFFTEFHKIEAASLNEAHLIQFNRPFCCIKDHDNGMCSKGLLFYSASQIPVIIISNDEIEQFNLLWKIVELEMKTDDLLQFDMLVIMLKRLIILCSRLFKDQKGLIGCESAQLDLIREFNYLVEVHYKNNHSVGQYAALLNKSPKTLSNLFAQYNQKSPLQIIQDRVLLEAKRMLLYSNKSIKEIAFEIGYEDIQTFSRFFKNKEGTGPKEFREQEKLITI